MPSFHSIGSVRSRSQTRPGSRFRSWLSFITSVSVAGLLLGSACDGLPGEVGSADESQEERASTEANAQALTAPAAEDPSGLRNDAVVSISTPDSGPGCTGVLVAPTLVLTAGHCLQGAIVDGGSGRWDSRNPIWRRYNLPEPRPQSRLDLGTQGRSTHLR